MEITIRDVTYQIGDRVNNNHFDTDRPKVSGLFMVCEITNNKIEYIEDAQNCMYPCYYILTTTL